MGREARCPNRASFIIATRGNWTGKRWGKPFTPPGDDKALIPRQFACAIAPDPICFLAPNGRQRATRAAYRTPLGKAYWVGRLQRHDELARTTPQYNRSG